LTNEGRERGKGGERLFPKEKGGREKNEETSSLLLMTTKAGLDGKKGKKELRGREGGT